MEFPLNGGRCWNLILFHSKPLESFETSGVCPAKGTLTAPQALPCTCSFYIDFCVCGLESADPAAWAESGARAVSPLTVAVLVAQSRVFLLGAIGGGCACI